MEKVRMEGKKEVDRRGKERRERKEKFLLPSEAGS